jgi:hypothetical protein
VVETKEECCDCEKREREKGGGYEVFICGWRWFCCFDNGVNALGV